MRNFRLPAILKPFLIALLIILLPAGSQAAGLDTDWIDLTQHRTGYTALVLFTLAYLLVMSEEFTHMRKSKPVILAAGVIWGLIAWQYHTQGLTHAAETAFRATLLEFSELFLFLLAAMTYVNAMDERQIFETLRS